MGHGCFHRGLSSSGRKAANEDSTAECVGRWRVTIYGGYRSALRLKRWGFD